MQKNEPISLLNLALSDDFKFCKKRVFNYIYSLPRANYAGIEEKPSDVIKQLGFNVIKSEANTIYECIAFRTTNEVKNLPQYIGKLPDDYNFADEIDNNPMLSAKPRKAIKYMPIAEE